MRYIKEVIKPTLLILIKDFSFFVLPKYNLMVVGICLLKVIIVTVRKNFLAN